MSVVLYIWFAILAITFYAKPSLCQEFNSILPVTISYSVVDGADRITDRQQLEAIATLKKVYRKELRLKVKSQVNKIPEFSPATVSNWQLQADRLRAFKYFETYSDLVTPRYNLLVDSPLVINEAKYFGGLATGICVRPGGSAVALAHATDYTNINNDHLKYRFALAQMHEVGHLLGAWHTGALDLNIMNTNILNLVKSQQRAQMHFAARSVAEIRMCLEYNFANQVPPATRCERKITRTNKVRCYLRRALSKLP
jgi:predicted Zn-dependent protease